LLQGVATGFGYVDIQRISPGKLELHGENLDAARVLPG
jgi:hypothetical protein